MKDVHKISLIALIYAILLALVAFIFFREYAAWAILGSATSLFNHSQMIRINNSKYTAASLGVHISTRFLLYIIILAFTYISLGGPNADTSVLSTAFVFLLLGIFAVKVGAIIYTTPLIKKTEIEKTDVTEKTDIEAGEDDV